MALLKFELTELHIVLCKNIDWESFQDNKNAFDGGSDVAKNLMYEEFGLIMYGKPDVEFDPTSSEEIFWSEEQKVEMDKYIKELPTALKVMLQTGEFEPATYRTKHYLVEWKKK